MDNPQDDPVAAFLAAYSPNVAATALAVRALVRELLPSAQEKVYLGWHAIWIGTGPKMADQLFVISPLTGRVNLNIRDAVRLPDPAGLLRGTGKAMRHIKLTQPDQVATPAVRALIAAAVAQAQTAAQE
ncbi:MAG: DUF1801 domain-containing protein [Chloroflexota bacterium]|nr:DUF1801 domain-containing protein [Chloroflexota bacterium]